MAPPIYYYFVKLKMKNQYFLVVLYFSEIVWSQETQLQALKTGFEIFVKSI
jgi:hypothetical protein